MGGGDQVQTGGALGDQLPEDLPQPLRRDGLAHLPLGDGAVLAEAAAQVTAGEKHRPRAVLAHKARLLPLVEAR